MIFVFRLFDKYRKLVNGKKHYWLKLILFIPIVLFILPVMFIYTLLVSVNFISPSDKICEIVDSWGEE